MRCDRSCCLLIRTLGAQVIGMVQKGSNAHIRRKLSEHSRVAGGGSAVPGTQTTPAPRKGRAGGGGAGVPKPQRQDAQRQRRVRPEPAAQRRLAEANDIFESPNQRVAVCREQRRTGEFHPTCPLSPVLSKPCATPECNCDLSHYHLFLSLGLGSPSQVRAVPCPLARGVLPFLSGPDPAHPRTQSSNFKYERQQQRIEAKEQRKRQRSAAKQQKELDKMHEAAGLLSTVFEESDSDDEAAAGVYGGFDVLLTTAAMR